MRRYGAHLRLAQNLGKQLNDLLGWIGPLTHRQFLAWEMFEDEEMNRPSRTDYYLMAIRAQLAGIDPAQPALKLQFGPRLPQRAVPGGPPVVDKDNFARYAAQVARFQHPKG